MLLFGTVYAVPFCFIPGGLAIIWCGWYFLAEEAFPVGAIGNAAALKNRLEIQEGLVEYLNDSGVSVKVKVKDKSTIPAFTGTVNFEYAKPAQKG